METLYSKLNGLEDFTHDVVFVGRGKIFWKYTNFKQGLYKESGDKKGTIQKERTTVK